MALVLKSDVAINGAALGDKHGIIGATDWRYMLDFANKEYLSQTAAGKIPLSGDGITFTRASSATYVDKSDRQLKTAAINEKRIHYSERLKRNGLLMESKKINHFINSDNPQTQTIRLVPSTYWVMVWVEGTGSVTVTGAGVSDAAGSGTQDSPIVFKNSGAISRDVLITVNGSLSFVQAEYVNNTTSMSAKIHTERALVEREADNAVISTELLSTAFSNGMGAVLLVADRYPIARIQPLVGSTNPLFSIEDVSGSKSISAARVLLGGFDDATNQEVRVRRFFGGVEQPLSFFANNDPSDKIAVSWGDGVVSVAQGGRVVSAALPDSFTPNLFEVGAATGWISSERRLDGIVNKVVLYDRQLTSAEMVAITKN